MMHEAFARTGLIVGEEGLDKLNNSKVMVFGVGGVGSFVVEALTRAGVGNIIIVDDDTVDISNLNRQIHATENTIGRIKVEVMKERILSINSKCNVTTHKTFILKDNIQEVLPDDVDYVVDAIDTVSAKIALAEYCEEKGIKLISSMGTGNKLDPTMFKIADVYETKICPLAKVMRHELRKRGVKSLKVLYSEEIPQKPAQEKDKITCISDPNKSIIKKRQVPGSISFVPPVAGMIIAGEVIKDILGIAR